MNKQRQCIRGVVVALGAVSLLCAGRMPERRLAPPGQSECGTAAGAAAHSLVLDERSRELLPRDAALVPVDTSSGWMLAAEDFIRDEGFMAIVAEWVEFYANQYACGLVVAKGWDTRRVIAAAEREGFVDNGFFDYTAMHLPRFPHGYVAVSLADQVADLRHGDAQYSLWSRFPRDGESVPSLLMPSPDDSFLTGGFLAGMPGEEMYLSWFDCGDMSPDNLQPQCATRLEQAGLLAVYRIAVRPDGGVAVERIACEDMPGLPAVMPALPREQETGHGL